MAKLTFYKTEVKYSGRYEDYTETQLFLMALAKYDKGDDCYCREIETDAENAKKWDGYYEVENKLPCNKIAEVTWIYADRYIAEEELRHE